MAYGNNQRMIDVDPVNYGIISGDEDQNGFVTLQDVLAVFNNAVAFINGYVVTDVNGDDLTDLNDIIITFNNAALFSQKITP